MHLGVFVGLMDSHCREEASRFFDLSLRESEGSHFCTSEIQLAEGLTSIERIQGSLI
jgi:hypothetical protein